MYSLLLSHWGQRTKVNPSFQLYFLLILRPNTSIDWRSHYSACTRQFSRTHQLICVLSICAIIQISQLLLNLNMTEFEFVLIICFWFCYLCDYCFRIIYMSLQVSSTYDEYYRLLGMVVVVVVVVLVIAKIVVTIMLHGSHQNTCDIIFSATLFWCSLWYFIYLFL